MKYRKKPVVIEAFKFYFDDMPDWFMDKVTSNDVILRKCDYNRYEADEAFCEIKTLEGVMVGNGGDYIIKGIKGEIYPCKPDIFEATYEAVVDNETTEGNIQETSLGQYNTDSEWSKHSRQESYVRLLLEARDKGLDVDHNDVLNEIKLLKPTF